MARGAGAIVALAVVAAWLGFGVDAGEAVRFVAYYVAFVLVPGLVVLRALDDRPGRLRTLVVGWTLGYALEILAFIGTATAGARAAFGFYPVVAIAVGATWVRHRGRKVVPESGAPVGEAWVVGVGVVALAAVGYVVTGYFTQTPLPGVAKVSYFQDLVFHLGLAGEALHHWPITDPKVSGVGLPYYTWANDDLAATAQITGIGLPTLLFRLSVVPLLLLVVAWMALLGRALTARAWAGPVAGALLLFVGEIDATPHEAAVFVNTLTSSLVLSPSFLLGLAFFAGAVLLVAERLSGEPRAAGGEWVVLGTILLGCAGAKAAAPPVLLGGVGLALLFRRRLPSREGVGVLALIVGTFVVFLRLYGGQSGGLAFDPPGTILVMRPVVLARELLGTGGAIVVGAVALLGFAGPTLAGLGVRVRGAPALAGARPLLAGLLVAGLVPLVLLSHPGASQNFFAYFGLSAGCVLSAEGLVLCLERVPVAQRRRLGLWAIAVFATLIVVGLAVDRTLSEPRAIAVVLALAAVMPGGAYVLARRARGPRRATLVGAAVLAIVAAGAVNVPLDIAPTLVDRARAGRPLWSEDGRGLTAGLVRGLDWIRTTSDPNDVIAADNYYLADGRDPGFMYYSALAERRVYLEGWGYALRSGVVGYADVVSGRKVPYPRRLSLNEAVFRRGDRGALRELTEHYGVRLLVADRANGGPTADLRRLGRTVFSNADVTIFAVGGFGANG